MGIVPGLLALQRAVRVVRPRCGGETSRGWCFLGSMMSASCSLPAHWWGADPAAVMTAFCLRRVFWGISPCAEAHPHLAGGSDSALCRGRQAGARTAGGDVDVVDQPQQMARAADRGDSAPGGPALVLDPAGQQGVGLRPEPLAAPAGGVAGMSMSRTSTAECCGWGMATY